MKVAITGGGNTYALNLANHLHSLGVEHFGIGRNPPKHPALWQVDHDYKYYVGHLIRDFDAVLRILDHEKPDTVINYAAQGEGAASFGENVDYYYATNIVALVRFAESLRKRDYVKRFIQIGTSELYGSTVKPAVETDALRPTSPYAISKAAFDQHLDVMHRVHGFPCNVVRPSNCYTRGQQLHRIIPRTIVCALSGKKLQLQGGGVARKSYMHATDLSRAVMDVIERGQVGKVYNCGPDEPISIRELVEQTVLACSKSFGDVVEVVPARVGEDSTYWLDSSAIKSDTGWKQTIGMYHGLEDMVRWVRDYPELLTMDSTYKLTA